MGLRLTRILVYPVKSTRGEPVTAAAVEPWGLAGDRRWAIVDEHGHPLRPVHCPPLLSVRAAPQPDGGVELTAPDVPPLLVSPPPATAAPVPIAFSRLDRAVPADAAAHAWLSAVLGRPTRLVWLDDPTRRPVSAAHGGQPGDVLSLADAGPLLLTSTASLRQLDEWIAVTAADAGEAPPDPLDIRRFRPNLVTDGETPFAEDGWTRVRVGAVPFRVAGRCDRCAITLFDPDTLRRGREPIRTLARHRRANGKVWFGILVVPVTGGTVRVGDPLVPETG